MYISMYITYPCKKKTPLRDCCWLSLVVVGINGRSNDSYMYRAPALGIMVPMVKMTMVVMVNGRAERSPLRELPSFNGNVICTRISPRVSYRYVLSHQVIRPPQSIFLPPFFLPPLPVPLMVPDPSFPHHSRLHLICTRV